MQYILNKEEYENLVPKEHLYALLDEINVLNEKILEFSGRPCARDNTIFGYCDDCPIGKLGTNTCSKIQDYSK